MFFAAMKLDKIDMRFSIMGTENTVDRRKHNRVKAQKDTFITLVNEFAKVGQIINISKGGLFFKHIGKEEQINDWYKMNIFLSSNRFFLKEVSLKTISDFCIEIINPFSKIFMKQCRGRFGELTRKQKSQLDYFINYLSIDGV